jgi:hypothetical protein
MAISLRLKSVSSSFSFLAISASLCDFLQYLKLLGIRCTHGLPYVLASGHRQSNPGRVQLILVSDDSFERCACAESERR